MDEQINSMIDSISVAYQKYIDAATFGINCSRESVRPSKQTVEELVKKHDHFLSECDCCEALLNKITIRDRTGEAADKREAIESGFSNLNRLHKLLRLSSEALVGCFDALAKQIQKLDGQGFIFKNEITQDGDEAKVKEEGEWG